MVDSSQIGCTKSELIPRGNAKGESFDLALCSQSIANSRVARDVLFAANVGRYVPLVLDSGQTKSDGCAASHTPSSTEATGTR